MGRGDGGLSRIKHDIIEQIIEGWGENRYSYALERLLWYQDKGDDMGIQMWQDIINGLKEKDNESIDMGKTD